MGIFDVFKRRSREEAFKKVIKANAEGLKQYDKSKFDNYDVFIPPSSPSKEVENNNGGEFNVVFLDSSPFKEEEPSKSFKEAVISSDKDALRYFVNHMDRDSLAKASAEALPFAQSAEIFHFVTSNCKEVPERAVEAVAGNIVENALKNPEPNLTKEDLILLKENGYKLTYDNRVYPPKSLYDCTKNKEDWFNLAAKEPGTIEHEFRQAVASQNYEKVAELFKVAEACGKTLDVNAKRKGGLSAVERAQTIENSELRQKMLDLFQKNAAIKPPAIEKVFYTSLPESSYYVQDPKILELKARSAAVEEKKSALKAKITDSDVLQAVKDGNLEKLGEAAKAGYNFESSKENWKALWNEAPTREVMEFLVKKRKTKITGDEVAEEERADTNDEWGFFNNRVAINRLEVLRAAYFKQPEGEAARKAFQAAAMADRR
ncbi:MAG: hypothetical protein J6Y03_03060 [Alphaproteobacteria bacterium]|nr:hypothetical protein [Alphaproteobacteria bacterium]